VLLQRQTKSNVAIAEAPSHMPLWWTDRYVREWVYRDSRRVCPAASPHLCAG
jgi:hypothetical protein